MRDRSSFALIVAGVSLALAIAGDALLHGAAWGVNLPLFILLTIACGYGLLRNSDVTLSRAAKWLTLPIIVFSLCFFWRDSDALKFANGFALVLAIAILAQRASVGKPTAATPLNYTIDLALSWVCFTADFAELATKDIDWSRSSQTTNRVKGIVRGLLLATPLLLVFGALFASADAAFNSAILDAFSFDASDVMITLFIVLVLAIFIGGLFRRLYWPSKPAMVPVSEPQEGKRPLGQTELVVALGLVDLLFVTFVGFQFRFLFGGSQHVAKVAGLTYAQYARGGFFELAIVAGLTIPMLIGAQALIPLGDRTFKRWFIALGSVLSACVFVILGSALDRMSLYVHFYGLSELRLFTTLFMGWLGVTLAWLCISSILRKKSFSFGALVAGYAFVLLANWINPDALIAHTNLDAAKNPDLGYLATLSIDAAPVISSHLDRLPPTERNKLWNGARSRWGYELKGGDWRSLNLSRLRFESRVGR